MIWFETETIEEQELSAQGLLVRCEGPLFYVDEDFGAEYESICIDALKMEFSDALDPNYNHTYSWSENHASYGGDTHNARVKVLLSSSIPVKIRQSYIYKLSAYLQNLHYKLL